MDSAKHYLLLGALLVILAACSSSDHNTTPTVADVSIIWTQQWMPVSDVFPAFDDDGDPLKVTKISEAEATVSPVEGIYSLSNGGMEIDGLNFTYTPMKSGAVTFRYTVSDGKAVSTATVEIAAAATDPLADQQWHLRNTGQKAYSLGEGLRDYVINIKVENGMTEAEAEAAVAESFSDWEKVLVPGEDMNVPAAYALGSTGQGVIAVVVDSGLEIGHEDLQNNVLPGRSLNFIPGVLDSTDPTSTATDGDHGTSVAGLIAATGWNGIGGRGVAPDARLIGMNYLEGQTDLNRMLSHGFPGSGIQTDDPVAVFNRSYGSTYPVAVSYDELEEAVAEFSAVELRSGKGAVNTKSAGNSFGRGDSSMENGLCAVDGANALGLSCYNANTRITNPYYFVVGAVNSDGKHASYSSAGANLLVAAPAGEYGDTAPAMVTTDQMTCLRGYASFASRDYYEDHYGPGFFAAIFPFNSPGHEDNSSCNYTASFNGTSSATPNVAGVTALILAANPDLTYRDVRHILVATSTKVDPDNAAVILHLANGDFIAQSGWVKNKAGYEYNNLYGFGRVNAGKAVAMAKDYGVTLGDYKITDWIGSGTYALNPTSLDMAVPDNSATCAEIIIEIPDDLVIEGTQLKFTIANPEMTVDINPDGTFYKEYQTTAGIDLAIEVTSPAGTRSVLLSSKQALLLPAVTVNDSFFQGYILKDTVLLSNAFYGEEAKGLWKIKVLDANGDDYAATGGVLNTKGYLNNTALSTVNGIAVRIYGH